MMTKATFRSIAACLLIVAVAGCSRAVPQASTQTAVPSLPPPTRFAPTSTSVPSQVPAGTTASGSDVGSVHAAGRMLADRAAHAATLLDNGEVLITGGFGQGDDTYRDSAELYDPVSGEFVYTGKMAIRRCCHSSTRLLDGRVLIAGGFNGNYLSNAEIYDPKTGLFTPVGPLTTPRMDHVAVLLNDGKVLLAGGVGTGWTFLASAELFDPATGSFTATGDMSVPRESHTVTKLLDGRVLITGGHRGRGSAITIYDSAEIYDPAAGVFSPTASMSVRRHKHDAVVLADGRVLITGGSDEHDDQNAYTSTEIYDPLAGVFRPAAQMPTIRYKHLGTSLLLKDGDALIAGGSRNAVLYDPTADQFRTVPGVMGTSLLSRLFSTATLMQNGDVLITGGYGIGQDVSSGAWIYSP